MLLILGGIAKKIGTLNTGIPLIILDSTLLINFYSEFVLKYSSLLLEELATLAFLRTLGQ